VSTASNRLTVFDSKCLDAVRWWHRRRHPSADLGLRRRHETAVDGTVAGTGSGKCLDPSRRGTADGTPLVLWTCTGAANQRWARS
jgi:hypothetical protein